MKGIRYFYFIFLSLIFVSCNKKEPVNTFKGINEFQIGAKFDTLKSFKLFEKVNDNEYNIAKYEVDTLIGFVENLNVKLYEGKIYEVSFTNGKFTNDDEVLKYLRLLKLDNDSKDYALNNESTEYRRYDSYDNKIEFNTYKYIDKELFYIKGFNEIRFTYSDKKTSETLLNNEKEMNDSIEKAEYSKDAKSL